MGRHSKPSRVKLPSGATVAAAPTIAGVAAAFCLTPPASASTVTADAAAANAVLASPVAGLGAGLGAGNAAVASTAAAASQSASPNAPPVSALPAAYRVRRGDSLSSIAAHLYHDRAAWPVLYWSNRKHIRWANEIYAGQLLRVPAKPTRIPQPPAALGPIVSPAPAANPTPLHVGTAAAGTIDATYTGGVPGGAFGACVVARESGGNAQVMNATGHYGLYQFSAATWAAYGGNPADFGHASVAEQNQVFANAIAAGGQSNWAPYDGC